MDVTSLNASQSDDHGERQSLQGIMGARKKVGRDWDYFSSCSRSISSPHDESFLTLTLVVTPPHPPLMDWQKGVAKWRWRALPSSNVLTPSSCALSLRDKHIRGDDPERWVDQSLQVRSDSWCQISWSGPAGRNHHVIIRTEMSVSSPSERRPQRQEVRQRRLDVSRSVEHWMASSWN